MKYYSAQMCNTGTIAVDDTILVKDVLATAGSHILEGFKPLFSAEAVTRLENSGYKISGKTMVGEFGLDLVGEFGYGAETDGAIMGAAAQLVKQNKVEAALGVDMNGAPRRSAALSDIDFLKPTYGTVSRYGVISCAASGEQLGVYAKNADGIAKIMTVIAGHDAKDGTSLMQEKYEYSTKQDVSAKKVCIVKELYDMTDGKTKENIDAFVAQLKQNGVTVEQISCDLFEIANTAWQILMCAETCNNVSRYDGVKYGYRSKNYKNIDELYVNSRTEALNFLTKAVILYGSDVLSKNRYKDCYDKSLRVRRVIADNIKQLLEKYDAIVTPVCSVSEFAPYDISEAFGKVFNESVFTSVANLIGIPALASGKVQLMGRHFDESTLLSLAACAERMGK